jgi:hypothetical protein
MKYKNRRDGYFADYLRHLEGVALRPGGEKIQIPPPFDIFKNTGSI